MTSAILAGTLMHARADHVAKRAFSYPLYMASIDLADLAALDRLRLFSVDRRNAIALYAADYATTFAEMRTLAPIVKLVTNPRVAGYTFNPVSFVLGYDERGTLVTAIAEVNNTYGGRHRYLLGDAERLPARADGAVGFRSERVFFVSPFLHGPMTYEFWFGARTIEMFVTHRETGSRVFTARFSFESRAFTDAQLARAAITYPLMTAQVIGLIYFEALLMHARGAPYRRPDADHRA